VTRRLLHGNQISPGERPKQEFFLLRWGGKEVPVLRRIGLVELNIVCGIPAEMYKAGGRQFPWILQTTLDILDSRESTLRIHIGLEVSVIRRPTTYCQYIRPIRRELRLLLSSQLACF